jgi:type VI secretion system secreted protein Hcp
VRPECHLYVTVAATREWKHLGGYTGEREAVAFPRTFVAAFPACELLLPHGNDNRSARRSERTRRKERDMFDAFLKVDGLDGESNDSKHKGEMEILSFHWGVTQAITGTTSSTGTFTGQRADLSPLIVTKQLDKASAKAAQACAAGDHFASAVLTLNRAGGDKQPYMEYKLSDVLISSYRVGGSAQGDGGVPLEEVAFNYGKIEWKYTQVSLSGKAAGNVAAGWDLSKNVKA